MAEQAASMPRWQKLGAWAFGIVGFVTILGALIHGPRAYDIKILTGDLWDEHRPPMYLVERRWWNLISSDYRLRFTENNRWEYERDGKWMTLNSQMEKQVDLEYWEYDESEPE
jgi:hypothetical protein